MLSFWRRTARLAGGGALIACLALLVCASLVWAQAPSPWVEIPIAGEGDFRLSNIHFTTRTQGWAYGASNAQPWLFRTADGGGSWTRHGISDDQV